MGKLENAVIKTKKLNALIAELNELFETHKQQNLVVTTQNAWLQRMKEEDAERTKIKQEIATNSQKAVDCLIAIKDLSPLDFKKRRQLTIQAKGYIETIEVAKVQLAQTEQSISKAEFFYNNITSSRPNAVEDLDTTSFKYWEKWKECKILAMSIDRDLGTSISQLFTIHEVSRFGEISLNDIVSEVAVPDFEVDEIDDQQCTIDDFSYQEPIQ